MLKNACLVIFSCCLIAYGQNNSDRSMNGKEKMNYNNSPSFDFKKYLFGESSTLSLYIKSLNRDTGKLIVRGRDSRNPKTPISWNWGDGNVDKGFFPQEHTYSDKSKNYVVTATALYEKDKTDSVQLLVRFVAPVINSITLSDKIIVSIPSEMPDLIARENAINQLFKSEGMYVLNPDLSAFDDTAFDLFQRKTIEYILSLAASIQMEFVNNDVALINGKFNQIMLRDSAFGGMYSLWFTSPVAFGVGDYGFRGSIQYSSFFHEMGHNFTLNSPSNYHYGGKSDGSANAILSESLAQIFQQATGYEIINNYKKFGLSRDIMLEIKQSVESSIKHVRNNYENYIKSGKKFFSWNNPDTSTDETVNTFMTIAYKFFAHAENSGFGYRQPLKRMMKLLQVFNEDLRHRYDQLHNTAEADTFRATLMTTAIGYGFDEDLREEFRNLNFPISDEIYMELIEMVDIASK